VDEPALRADSPARRGQEEVVERREVGAEGGASYRCDQGRFRRRAAERRERRPASSGADASLLDRTGQQADALAALGRCARAAAPRLALLRSRLHPASSSRC
jgi:hypothetical protein